MPNLLCWLAHVIPTKITFHAVVLLVVDAQNDDGDTVLHWTVRTGLRGCDLVWVLIENGCRPAILNIYFKRAIDVCADGFHLAATVAACCVEGEKSCLPFKQWYSLAPQWTSENYSRDSSHVCQISLKALRCSPKASRICSFSTSFGQPRPRCSRTPFPFRMVGLGSRSRVNRAHIVNPSDGSLLEELISTKLGVNTCLYNEDQAQD